MICPHCAFPNDPGARVCRKCQRPLEGTAGAPAGPAPVTEPPEPITDMPTPSEGAAGQPAAAAAAGNPVSSGTDMVAECLALAGQAGLRRMKGRRLSGAERMLPCLAAAFLGVGVIFLLGKPHLLRYMLPSRFDLDANHFLVAAAAFAAGLGAFVFEKGRRAGPAGEGEPGRRGGSGPSAAVLGFFLFLAVLAGILVFFKIPGIDPVTRVSYTVLDLAMAFLLAGALFVLLKALFKNFKKSFLLLSSRFSTKDTST